MNARVARWLAYVAYLLIMFILLLVVGKVFGAWWKIAVLPIALIGAVPLGYYTGHDGGAS